MIVAISLINVVDYNYFVDQLRKVQDQYPDYYVEIQYSAYASGMGHQHSALVIVRTHR